MQQKKELLIKVITKLKWHWDLAEGFLALIKSDYMNNEIMDTLISALQESIGEVNTNNKKEKITKWLRLIYKIRNQEDQEDNRMTDEDLDKILETM